MLIGVPKERKIHEYRVGLTPTCVDTLIRKGHKLIVESNLGEKIGFTNELYRKAGATVVESAEEVYQADMVVKVKEPIESEYPFLRKGLILFCFLHLAPNAPLTKKLVDSGVVAIAYETVSDSYGHLPLLLPMSEVAGRIAMQEGARALQLAYGGKGLLLGGVPGVLPAKVTILGGGVVGTEAARMASGLGADVTILDTNLKRLKELEFQFSPMIKTLYSSPSAVAEFVAQADVVVGSVLIPGKRAPKIVTKKIMREMEAGSVFVDVAIDQGGCSETSKPTSHDDPLYIDEGVVHYCVTNMPGACSKTSSMALTNATLAYTIQIANKGYRLAMQEDPGLRSGLNVHLGSVTNEHVANDLGYTYHPPEKEL